MAASTGSAIPSMAIPTAYVPIIISGTDASTTVLAAAAGQIIDVWGYDLYTNGITDLVLKSDTTDITGILGFGASSGPSYIGWPMPSGSHRCPEQRAAPRCSTASGGALVLTNSGSGVRVSGTIWVNQRLATLLT